jgi:DNA-binding response OmpR family regulator
MMTTTADVLILSRDKAIAHVCATHLRTRGYAVVSAQNLRQSLALTKARHLDAIVIDLTSLQSKPERISSQLRLHSLAPLIFIVRANAKLDVILKQGATVYKPISARQLVTTVKSAIARKAPHELARGPFRLDLEKHVLTHGSKKIHLMKKEVAVLKLLMQHEGRLVTRELLMREVWETAYMGDTRVIEVNIRWLRQKMEDKPSQPQYLLTVRGQGYLFRTKETPPR